MNPNITNRIQELIAQGLSQEDATKQAIQEETGFGQTINQEHISSSGVPAPQPKSAYEQMFGHPEPPRPGYSIRPWPNHPYRPDPARPEEPKDTSMFPIGNAPNLGSAPQPVKQEPPSRDVPDWGAVTGGMASQMIPRPTGYNNEIKALEAQKNLIRSAGESEVNASGKRSDAIDEIGRVIGDPEALKAQRAEEQRLVESYRNRAQILDNDINDTNKQLQEIDLTRQGAMERALGKTGWEKFLSLVGIGLLGGASGAANAAARRDPNANNLGVSLFQNWVANEIDKAQAQYGKAKEKKGFLMENYKRNLENLGTHQAAVDATTAKMLQVAKLELDARSERATTDTVRQKYAMLAGQLDIEIGQRKDRALKEMQEYQARKSSIALELAQRMQGGMGQDDIPEEIRKKIGPEAVDKITTAENYYFQIKALEDQYAKMNNQKEIPMMFTNLAKSFGLDRMVEGVEGMRYEAQAKAYSQLIARIIKGANDAVSESEMQSVLGMVPSATQKPESARKMFHVLKKIIHDGAENYSNKLRMVYPSNQAIKKMVDENRMFNDFRKAQRVQSGVKE